MSPPHGVHASESPVITTYDNNTPRQYLVVVAYEKATSEQGREGSAEVRHRSGVMGSGYCEACDGRGAAPVDFYG